MSPAQHSKVGEPQPGLIVLVIRCLRGCTKSLIGIDKTICIFGLKGLNRLAQGNALGLERI